MAVYTMKPPTPGSQNKPASQTKPPSKTKPYEPAPMSMPAPPPPQHGPHVSLPSENKPPAASGWPDRFRQGGSPIQQPQSYSTTWGMPPQQAQPPQQTTQPIGNRMGMSGGFTPPPQTTQPIGGRMGGQARNWNDLLGSQPTPQPPPQTTQPIGNRIGMSGSFGPPQQTTQPIGGRIGGTMMGGAMSGGSMPPPPQATQPLNGRIGGSMVPSPPQQSTTPTGQRIGGSMSGGGALADALGRAQGYQQRQPQGRSDFRNSTLFQMLR